MLMLTVSALITNYETVGDHTEFVAQISCNGEVWLVSRRYSDFSQLHSRLVSRFGDLVEARLPEKQWFGRFDSNFLAKRQASLQSYLESVLLTPGILEDRSLQHFLDLEKRVDWSNGDLAAGGVGSNGRPSGSFPHKSATLNETDRLSAIVENAGLAFIDISEVPEPLEAEQAVQRKNEIATAAQTQLNDAHVASHFAARLSVLQLPHAAPAVSTDEIVARLERSSNDSATLGAEQALLRATLARVEASLALAFTAPTSELLAVMDLSLTPAAAAASATTTTSRSSLSGALESESDASLSASFH